jgi:hypothetical protein
MGDKIYSFQYCECIHESAFETISIHKTVKGAYSAMRKYILKEYNQWREDGLKYGKQIFKHGCSEAWRVVAIQIKE